MRLASLSPAELTDLDGGPIAAVAGFNPLASDPESAAAALPESRLILGWSGGLGDALFDRSFRTWMPKGREALARYLDAAEAELERRDARLLIRTHARHVVSDAVAARSLLTERGSGRIGIALDPAGCLEPSMLPDAEDHLRRLFDVAGALAEVLVLSSTLAPAGAQNFPEPPLEPAALGEGVLDAKLLGELTRAGARHDAIVAAQGPEPERQLRAAGLL